jgi:hypothetical protein
MSAVHERPEPRPSIKVTATGKPYLLVHTRRGPRTRQLTRAGWNWVRAKYPADPYVAPEDIPLTYADYKEMRVAGFIGVSEQGHAVSSGARPLMRYAGEQLQQLFKENQSDPAVLRQLAGELRHRTVPTMQQLRQQVQAALAGLTATPVGNQAGPSATGRVKCQRCGKVQRDAARFCPACGTSRYTRDARPALERPTPASAPSAPPCVTNAQAPTLVYAVILVITAAVLLTWRANQP